MKIIRSALWAMIVMAPVAAPQAETTNPLRPDGLTLELHVAAPRVAAAPQVEITAVVQNAGPTALSLRSRPQWLGRCGLTLRIRSPGGQEKTVPDDDGECLNTKPREGFPLAPGNAVVVAKTLDRAKHFATPGTYVVTVAFTEPGAKALVSSPAELIIR